MASESSVGGAQANGSAWSSTTPFLQLSLGVQHARLNNVTGLLKPNPYLEVIVDGKPPKKTEVQKSTYHPKWHSNMSLMVTPYTKINFRLYDYSTFKKDALLGEVCLDFYSVLKKHCGRCHKLDLGLDLRVSDSKNGASPSDTKIGTLHIVLDGLTVDLRQIPAASPPVVSIFSWEPAL